MLLALLFGTLLGFVLAIPPGPVAVAVLKSGLDGNQARGLKIGLGAVVMDILYCVIIMLAMGAIQVAASSFADNYPVAVMGFKISCVVGIVAYGFYSLKRNQPPAAKVDANASESSFVERIKSHGPFFIGVGIAIANLANPTFIPALWATTTYVFYSMNVVQATLTNVVLFSFGFGLGTYAWVYIFLRLIIHYRNRMSTVFIDRLHKFAGLTLIGFGTLLGIRVFAATKWSELFRLVFAF